MPAVAVLRQRAADALDAVIEQDDRYYLPPSDWIRFFSLGYTEAAADLIWVKTVLYFGENVGGKKDDGNSKFLSNYLLSAVDLDPRFRSCYTVGSTLTMFQNRGRVSEKTVRMALALLERGIKVFPDDGELFFSLGFIHYYEIARFLPKDLKDPSTRKHKELGRYYLGRCALMKGAPPYASNLAATLMLKEGLDAAVLEHLTAMLVKETNPTVRAELIKKIRDAAGKAAEADIAETERLQRDWLQDLPYIPYDFYLVLRVEAPVREILDPLFYSNGILGLNEPVIPNDEPVETDGFVADKE